MTHDAALAKLAAIETCLGRIRDVTGNDPDSVDTLDTEEIVVPNLQRAVQAAIDLTAHLISGKGWGLPDSLRAHFRILGEQGVLDRDLAGSAVNP